MITGQSTYLRALQIIFFGLFTGPILFLGVVLFLQSGTQHVEQTINSSLFFIAMGLASAGIIGSRAYYNNQKSKLKALANVNAKLDGWRTTFIVRVAIMEAPILLCLVGLLLEYQRVFLVLAVVLTAFQALNFPKRDTVQRDLALTDEEMKLVD